MDLAGGHINALDGLTKDTTWATPCPGFPSSFGGSGGKYKAYNLGKGRGQSVFESASLPSRSRLRAPTDRNFALSQ